MDGALSNRIRVLRFLNGEMSQADLGQRIRVTRQTIAAIEAGNTRLPWKPPSASRRCSTFRWMRFSSGSPTARPASRSNILDPKLTSEPGT